MKNIGHKYWTKKNVDEERQSTMVVRGNKFSLKMQIKYNEEKRRDITKLSNTKKNVRLTEFIEL